MAAPQTGSVLASTGTQRSRLLFEPRQTDIVQIEWSLYFAGGIGIGASKGERRSMAVTERNRGQNAGWFDVLLFTWLQVFGIGGSVGLASIIQHLIFWKGVFAEFVSWWDTHIRPMANWLFSWAFDLFHLNLTDFWKDYLAIGTIVGLGFLRHYLVLLYKMGRNDPIEFEGAFGKGPLIPPFLPAWTRHSPMFYALISPVLWPLTLVVFIADTVRAVWPASQFDDKRFILYSVSTVVLPFYYLLLLVAINEYVLK